MYLDGNEYTFKVANSEHASHSFCTCVTPPISKAAGFDILVRRRGLELNMVQLILLGVIKSRVEYAKDGTN